VRRIERRIPVGPLVAVIGALLLIVSLFLDWYEDITGFTVFEANDLVLVTLALLAVLSLADEFGVRSPVRSRRGRAPALGAIALVLVLSQLVNDPPAVVGDGAPDHAIGIWLALAGGVLMTGGALLAGARISLAVDVRRREPRVTEADTVRPDETRGDDPGDL